MITGGAGFIGSHVADALVARGDELLILDDLSTGRRDNIGHLLTNGRLAGFVEGSVLDEDLVDDCMRSVDACLHLAAAVGVQLVVSQPLDSLRRNVRGSDNVISAAARHRKPLLFTSSSEVYGRDRAEPLAEDADRTFGSPFQTRWAYATSKTFAETLAQSCVRELGSEMVVARLFNVVGPRQTGAYGMVLPRFVRQALTGEDLTVYGDGTQARCFLHVDDSVQGLLGLIDSQQAAGGVFNVGSSTEVRIVDLARRVIERTGSSSGLRFVSYDAAYEPGFEDLDRRVPDPSALRRLTGWAPTRSIDDAIDDVVDFAQRLEAVGGGTSGAA